MAKSTKQVETKPKDVDDVKESAAFPWLFTPNFFLGLLLLSCLLLPGFRGCNDETVPFAVAVVYYPATGFIGLPQYLGLIMILNTSVLCLGWKTKRQRSAACRFAWRTSGALAVLIGLASTRLLLFLFCQDEMWNKKVSWQDFIFWSAAMLYGIVPLIGCLFIRLKKTAWIRKATLMQFLLSLLSIASAVYFLPIAALAGAFYIGGKLLSLIHI